jgi:chorismate dehydratase
MDPRKRLGLNSELYCAPLFEGLAVHSGFLCTQNLVAHQAVALRSHDLDAAFLSPIDYGRESSDYVIVPDVAVSSTVPTQSVVLCFKQGLHTLSSIAVHPAYTSEIVLATILLGERFDVTPRVVPVDGPLERMLLSADAALLVGNAARTESCAYPNTLDLVEEWNDMTDLPYVHGFWCLRENGLSHDDIQRIQQAARAGASALDTVVSSIRSSHPGESDESLLAYLNNFSFGFGEIEQEALAEFLRYAFYHGVLPDVADINVSAKNEDDSFGNSPSLN